jgi:hypothetical protein
MDTQNQTAKEAPSRRRGRPPAAQNSGMTKITMLLDPEDTEWAKAQPGGLSGMVRHLLNEAHKKAEGKQK